MATRPTSRSEGARMASLYTNGSFGGRSKSKLQGGKTKAQDCQAELNYSSDAYLEEQDDAEFSPDQQGRSLRLVGHWS